MNEWPRPVELHPQEDQYSKIGYWSYFPFYVSFFLYGGLIIYGIYRLIQEIAA